jgi:hypothetical protein
MSVSFDGCYFYGSFLTINRILPLKDPSICYLSAFLIYDILPHLFTNIMYTFIPWDVMTSVMRKSHCTNKLNYGSSFYYFSSEAFIIHELLAWRPLHRLILDVLTDKIIYIYIYTVYLHEA